MVCVQPELKRGTGNTTEHTCVDVQSLKHNVSLNNVSAAQCLPISFFSFWGLGVKKNPQHIQIGWY